jgi:hypothetical protein
MPGKFGNSNSDTIPVSDRLGQPVTSYLISLLKLIVDLARVVLVVLTVVEYILLVVFSDALSIKVSRAGSSSHMS